MNHKPFNFKKKYGQNFLQDQNILKKIIALSEPNDFNVIEIGPGSGQLSEFLFAAQPKFLDLYEIDADLIPLLQNRFIHQKGNWRLNHMDFIKSDLNQILELTEEYKVVANLPYYISTKIIFKLLPFTNIISINIMLQKELVDRINAKVSTKEYGRFSVAINSFYQVVDSFIVSRNVFEPAPNVDSAFIRLDRMESFTSRVDDYLEFVKQAFAARRKTLLNNLKNNDFFYNLTKEYLSSKNLSLSLRAENLSVNDFQAIWSLIEKTEKEET